MLINEVFIMLIRYPGLIFCIAMIALTIYMVDTLKITYKFNREDFIQQLKEDIILWILNFVQVVILIYYFR